MGYNQGLPPRGASWPQPSYYDPYSYDAYAHHYAAAASVPSYHHPPPPPGTERSAPAASSSSSAAGASYHAAVGGANPAVAARSQTTSFASSIGASERGVGHQAYYAPQYPPAQHTATVGGIGTLRGGSGGGGPLHGGGRGRGRGSSMYHPLVQNVGVTSPCSRGRGRGRGRGSKATDRQLAIQAHAGSSASEAQPGMASAPVHVVQVTTANIAWGPVLPAAWCDICRVECNSKEILEQHKNGKRHKRTVQRMQDMARLQGMTPVISGMGAPASQVGGLPATSYQLAEVRGPSTALHMAPPLGSCSLSGREHKDLASENVTAAVAGVQVTEATGNSSQQNTAVGHKVEAQVELHAAAVQACQPSNEMIDGGEAPPSNATGPSDAQSVEARMAGNSSRNGSKRKIRGAGHGGKKLRASQTPWQRPERVREQPLVCTICNVTCDTRAVFVIHLGGKKHQLRLKRSQGPDTVFGPLVVYNPPSQPVAPPTGAPEPLYYGLMTRDMVEQEAYLPGVMQMQHALPVLPQAGQTITAADGGTKGTSGATYSVQPMPEAMGAAEKSGPGTEQVGNGGR